jgi:hypothetical protein
VQVAKKKGVSSFRVSTRRGTRKACVVHRGESPATRRRCDPPPADHPFAGLKTIQAVVVLNNMPVSNANRAVGTPGRPQSV